MLKALSKALDGKFYNYHAKQMDRFRRHGHTIAAYDQITQVQNDSDILIVPGQFGICHRGRSVRHACKVIKDTTSEFGESARNGATMLLTHPNRLAHGDDLWLDFPGDEFDDPDAGVCFASAPTFVFSYGGVGFGTRWCGRADDGYGSVSGFVPQS